MPNLEGQKRLGRAQAKAASWGWKLGVAHGLILVGAVAVLRLPVDSEALPRFVSACLLLLILLCLFLGASFAAGASLLAWAASPAARASGVSRCFGMVARS